VNGEQLMSETISLIEVWRACDLTTPPFLFPGDQLAQFDGIHSVFRSFEEYIDHPDFGNPKDTRIHLGLFPIPYIGDLANASIFLLMLNPGFAPCDYYVEHHYPGYRSILKRNLLQETTGDDYPFFCLDPQLSWTGGYEYWARKLSSIIQATINQNGMTPQEAMQFLAKKLAVLELMPYHSLSFGAGYLLNELESVLTMKRYVKDVVIPKAITGKAVVIATRAVKHWNLPNHENIIQYQGSEARAAYLTTGSRGGKAILQQFGLAIHE
jgi:hypothetical protein